MQSPKKRTIQPYRLKINPKMSTTGSMISSTGVGENGTAHEKSRIHDLDKPQYNSSLKLIKKFDDLNLEKNKNIKVTLPNEQLERIHEKASHKLNLRGQIFEGLVSVDPNPDDFIKYLEIKNKNRVRPQIQPKNNQKAPDLMEFYPYDLIKEYSEVDIEPIRQTKFTTVKASSNLTNDPINKYFAWN